MSMTNNHEIINLEHSPAGRRSRANSCESEKSTLCPIAEARPWKAVDSPSFAAPTPWASSPSKPWNIDSSMSKTTVSSPTDFAMAAATPWSAASTDRPMFHTSPWSTPTPARGDDSTMSTKEQRAARAPWNQGDDSTTSGKPISPGSYRGAPSPLEREQVASILDLPNLGSPATHSAMTPPPPPPPPTTGLPYSSPNVPGKYMIEDQFGDAIEETVIWTGVKLRKPNGRADPRRKLVIQSPNAMMMAARHQRKPQSRRSPAKRSPKTISSPHTSAVGTPGSSKQVSP